MRIKRLLALLAALCILLSSAPAMAAESAAARYDQALSLLQQNRYAEAGSLFADIGNYEDATLYTMYCQAAAAGENGQYKDGFFRLWR